MRLLTISTRPSQASGLRMVKKALINEFFQFGLGNLLVMHCGDSSPILGQVVQDNGRLTLKDCKLLQNVSSVALGPCKNVGIVGAVCVEQGNEWEGLTFVGPEHCDLNLDLSATHVGRMTASINAFSERLIDFHGSVYRGFQLMFDNRYLPVVMIQEVVLKRGGTGLAVTNMRVAGVSIQVLSQVHEHLVKLMVHDTSFDVRDMALDETDFESMFARFKAG